LNLSTSPLQITLFGPFSARVHGELMPPLRSCKSEWLLALLALRAGERVDRAWLSAALWPDSLAPQALANLRTCLKDLRRALGSEAWRITAPTTRVLALTLSGAAVDVALFDAGIARGDSQGLSQAVALYGGPLLEGCPEEWIFPEREAREQACLAALERLAAIASAEGDHASAVRRLRQAVALDPLRESAQRALMQALAAGGNRAAALLVYRELQDRMHRELHASPDPETTALFEQLRAASRPANAEKRQTAKRPSVPVAPSPPVPTSPTPLLGRRSEVAALTALLTRRSTRRRQTAARLVTLTGPGGTGKTRLALEVGSRIVHCFPDGVYVVSLAPVRDPALLLPTLMQNLGIREEPGRAPREAFVDYLRDRKLLLLLDNFEQLLPAAPEVAELLAGAPGLQVLVTSRAVLRLRGEREFPVSPLALPDKGSTPETLCQYAAVALFIERAKAACPEFVVTDSSAPAVAAICQRLDGLPLAIELAAVRIKLFPPEALLARLSSRLRFLTSGPRDLPARQQTLRDTFDWSYHLLSPSEKRLFRRLAVFVGGCMEEAAAAVCAHDLAPDSEGILELLASLVDQSLLRCERGTEGGSRFWMLETIREYGQECLEASGESEKARERHARFFLALAEQAREELSKPSQAHWYARLEQEHANSRAAMEWAISHGDAETGLRLACALCPFWDGRYYQEGWEYLTTLLALPAAGARTSLRARALVGAAGLSFDLGDLEASRSLAEEGLAIGRELRQKGEIAAALTRLGITTRAQGHYPEASALLTESLGISRELGDLTSASIALLNLGNNAAHQGDFSTAQTLYEESLAIRRALGHRRGIASAQTCLALVAASQGEFERAKALYEESLALSGELADVRGMANILQNMGALLGEQGELAAARERLEQSLALNRKLGSRPSTQDCLADLALVTHKQGDHETTRALLLERLQIVRELGDRSAVADTLERLAATATAQGQAVSMDEAVALALHGMDASRSQRD
jgi:predicted ATPase/DNA-binding SARP family transcriptional activator